MAGRAMTPRVGERALNLCCRADAVAQAGDARPLGAMLAAEENPFLLESVAHDADAAIVAFRRTSKVGAASCSARWWTRWAPRFIVTTLRACF